MNLRQRERAVDPILLFVKLDSSGPPVGTRGNESWELPVPGSGGYIKVRPYTRRVLTGTGGKLAYGEHRPTLRQPEHAADLLRLVRTALSLNMTELAGAVGVERPTVYAWLAGKSNPQSANRERLERLASYARLWKRIGTRPLGRLVRSSATGGSSVCELLCRESIPQAQLIEQLQRLAALSAEAPRVRPAREVAQALGAGELREDEIDVATGKRFNAE